MDIVFFLLLGMVGTFFAVGFFATRKKLDHLRMRIESLKTLEEAHGEAVKVMHAAAAESSAIIREGRIHALQMVDEIGRHAVLDQKTLDGDLAAIRAEIREEYKKNLHTLTTTIEAQTKEELAMYWKTLGAMTSRMEESLRQKTEEAFASVERDIARYKATQEKKLDAQMVTIARRTIEKILGKSLTAQDHTQLVLDALQEAKRTHVFSK